MLTKVCTKCKSELPATKEHFNACEKYKDKLNSQYKTCKKQYYLNNREKYLQQSKKLRESKKEYLKEYHKEYRAKNKEKIKELDKEYRTKNKEKIKEYKRKLSSDENYKKRIKKYKETRKDRDKELYKIWVSNNKERRRETKRIREQRKKSLYSDFNTEKWNKCLIYFESKCCYCGELDLNLTQDHFIPVTKDGTYTVDNIVPACKSCNSSKKNADFKEWYSWQDFYSEERETKLLNYLGYVLEKPTQKPAKEVNHQQS